MFKKSRRKIVVAIMSVLALLFLGTLAVIYGSSYFEVSKTNYDMLWRYARLYYLEKQSGDISPNAPHIPNSDHDAPKPNPDDPHFENIPAFHLATFYSVAVSYSGDILATDNGDGAVYDDEILEQCAVDIIPGFSEHMTIIC